MPIAAYDGRQPIRNDAPDMNMMEIARAPLRPFLSPKLPQNSAPIGRSTNDSANTPNVCSMATV